MLYQKSNLERLELGPAGRVEDISEIPKSIFVCRCPSRGAITSETSEGGCYNGLTSRGGRWTLLCTAGGLQPCCRRMTTCDLRCTRNAATLLACMDAHISLRRFQRLRRDVCRRVCSFVSTHSPEPFNLVCVQEVVYSCSSLSVGSGETITYRNLLFMNSVRPGLPEDSEKF